MSVSGTEPTGMDRYCKTNEPALGDGLHGKVIKAIDLQTNEVVAIKKIKRAYGDYEGDKVMMREVKFLKELDHVNIIKLKDVFEHKNKVRMVCEYLDTDLERVIKNENVHFSETAIRDCMQMILSAVAHCHEHQVIHRDIKPSNLLIARDGSLKLADFGTSRFSNRTTECQNDYVEDDVGKFTPQMFVRWYRPPELLLGCTEYGCSVDMWAVGCVFAELMLRKPYFACQEDGDIKQLRAICQRLGSPSEEQWLDIEKGTLCPGFRPHKGLVAEDKREVFENADPQALELLEGLLCYSPKDRFTAQQALDHSFFSSAVASSSSISPSSAGPSTSAAPTLVPILSQHFDHSKQASQSQRAQIAPPHNFRRPLSLATPCFSLGSSKAAAPHAMSISTAGTQCMAERTPWTEGSSLGSRPMCTPATDNSQIGDEITGSGTKKRKTHSQFALLNAFEEVADKN